MAQFTSLQDPDIAIIAAAYQLGAVQSWQAITAGTVNSNFALSTDRGRFFVRVNEGKTLPDVEWEAALLAALGMAGVAIAPLCVTTEQRVTLPLLAGGEAKYISVFPWLHGRHLAADDVDITTAAAVGRLLAHLHQATAPLLPTLARPNRYDFAEISRRAQSFAQSTDPALQRANATIALELQAIAAVASVRHRAGQVIIHGDLFRDNVLWSSAATPTLLDFEQASVGSAAYDLAVCLHDWAWRGPTHEAHERTLEAGSNPDWGLVEALLRGYHAVRPLQFNDIVALPWELRMSAVRFTVTRVTDVYLANQDNPDKDFRAFLARADYWRSEAANAQLLQLTNSMVAG